MSASAQMPKHDESAEGLRGWPASGGIREARPHPSLKPSPNSRALGRRGYAVHHQPRRPSARLLGPA